MVDTLFFAYIDVTKAFFPLLKRTKGRVVNIGSFGGYSGRSLVLSSSSHRPTDRLNLPSRPRVDDLQRH